MTAPTRSPSLGALLIGSSRAERLRQWYRAMLGIERDGECSGRCDDEAECCARLQVGGAELIIVSQPMLEDANREPHRMTVAFVVPDAAAVEARLVAMHAVWAREFQATPWGVMATVIDPDGNHVQLIEPAAEPGA